MAHMIAPQHKAHDQLRTEPAGQRDQKEKYVSAFVSAESTVDFSFSTPILPKSSSHYTVGVGELTVNLGSLSMIEPNDDVLFRIIRRGRDGQPHADWVMPAPYTGGFEFRADRTYGTMQEVLERLKEIQTAIQKFFYEVNLNQAALFEYVQDWTGEDDYKVKLHVDSSGSFVVQASPRFWANFVLEVPLKKYQAILFDTTDRQYVSMHPTTGDFREPYAIAANGNLTTLAFANPAIDAQAYAQLPDRLDMFYMGTTSLFHTLDRRVTVEVGCSLPLKNSPMIDHGKEAPDVVLGRYMFHRPYDISRMSDANIFITDKSIGAQQLQGPNDRIVYHALSPQQKIQQLRLKLWLRVRTYDEAQEKWGMKTIVCPVVKTDYWHIRLHFKEIAK